MSLVSDLNPQALAVKALVTVVAVTAIFAAGAYVGYRHEKLIYDNYVLKQKDAADKQLAENQAALKSIQAQHDAAVDQIHTEYTENAQHLQAARDAAIANASASADSLRRYIATAHVKQPGMSGAKGGSAGTPATGESSAGLSDGVSSLNWYLTQRFSRADDVAIRLNEAIDLLAEDRRVCNGALPGVTKQ